MAKIGRNQPCLCGSGKKYKRCHGNLVRQGSSSGRSIDPRQIENAIRRHQAHELLRVQQQGEGKPIISAELHDRRFVAVGDRLYHSSKWRFFPDFLLDYSKMVIGSDWGQSELRKPWDDRHPILHWYHHYCVLQQGIEKHPDGSYCITPTGAAQCYLGLAYGLYLLRHNVELQNRFVARLRNLGNFQGAYYELIVASCLIRAGFELTLEDETDRSQKHCEFAAVSKKTGKKYSVEAKMKSVAGILGKTNDDGASPHSSPDSRVTTHLRQALRKPADGERFVFIDVNTPAVRNTDSFTSEVPNWINFAARRLERSERDLNDDVRAYVFITNFPFHWHLEDELPPVMVLAHGLGIADFGKPGYYRLSETWRSKQRHIDGHRIMESLGRYPHVPSTFDGSLPLTDEENQNRLIIGETYLFEDFGDGGVLAEVTSVAVSEPDKQMYVGIYTLEGDAHILTRSMSDSELEHYRLHGEAIFGVSDRGPKNIEEPYELFEFFMDGYKDTPRATLIQLLEGRPDYAQLESLDDTELRLVLCEGWTYGVLRSSRSEAS